MLMISLSALAQNTDELKKEIAKIKKNNSQYIYAEAVANTKEEAEGLADELLNAEVIKWASTMKKMQGKTIIVGNTKQIQEQISLPRGNMFRSFIFVKKSDILATNDAQVIGESTTPQESVSTVTPVFSETVMTIASYNDYYQMTDKIKELKTIGKIGHFARYGNLERPDIYYLAIYNQQGQVVAVLSSGQKRINVKTGQPDELTNYSGCGAIGFTIKE